MTGLYELRVTEPPSGGGPMIPLVIELIEIQNHPPLYAIAGGDLVDQSPRTTLAQERIDVPLRDLDPLLGYLPTSLQDVGALLREWVSLSEPPRAWGAFDWTARRIVVDVDPIRSRLPWEQMGDWMRPERVTIVRQVGTDPPHIDRYLDRRIEIAMESVGDDATLLLDQFSIDAAIQHGTVAWGRPAAQSDVWHILASDESEVVRKLKRTRGPRVVVIQIAPGANSEFPAILETAFARGAWAVVMAEVSREHTQTFFHPFYRKLLHNWPLEFCVWAGTEALNTAEYPARLFVRPGGELALSLSRIPPELALTPLSAIAERMRPSGPAGATVTGGGGFVGGALSPPPAERGPRSSRPHPRALPAWGTSPIQGFPSQPSIALPPPPVPGRRARVVADIRERLESSTTTAMAERFESSMRWVDDLAFSEEAHDHGSLSDVTRDIRSAKEEGAPLIAELEASPPGPRWTNVSFRTVRNRRLKTAEALIPGRSYRLDVVVQPTSELAHISAVFDESRLAEEFKKRETLSLAVVVFSPPTEFAIPANRSKLDLPRVGSSTHATFELSPQHEGWCALRVAIYYRNTMLQSLAINAFANRGGAVPAGLGPAIRKDFDWAATTDLQLLDDLAPPIVNIFSNEAPDGSHWIGVFSDEENVLRLRSGNMWKLDAQTLTGHVKKVRKGMETSHGKKVYLYPADKPPSDPDVVAFGKKSLVELAQIGRQAYDSLVQLAERTPAEGLKAFDEALAATDQARPGIISIARCDSTWSAPWAVMYDKFLDLDQVSELKICSVVEEQLKANVWSESKLVHRRDLLDEPAKCRAQTSCPLNDEAKRATTVCPLGFWGFRYQIEQPLQQVAKVVPGEVPAELTKGDFSQSNQIERRRGKIRLGAASYPFPRIDSHRSELESISDLAIDWESERSKVLELLYHPDGHDLVYFYCHGKKVNDVFALQTGPKSGAVNTIRPASIEKERVQWGKLENSQPLVIVIACESLAAYPEVAHDLFAKLKQVHASGVVGSEISIGVRLGREVGLDLMRALVEGTSIGEAMLQMRLSLLRRFNPLGLALTSNAPATLHLCDDPDGKGDCKRYHVVRTP